MKKLLFAALSLWLAALCFARAGGGDTKSAYNKLVDR